MAKINLDTLSKKIKKLFPAVMSQMATEINIEALRTIIMNANQDATQKGTDQFETFFFQSQANEFPVYGNGVNSLYPKLVPMQFYTHTANGKSQTIEVNVPLITLMPLTIYQISQIVFKPKGNDMVVINFPGENN